MLITRPGGKHVVFCPEISADIHEISRDKMEQSDWGSRAYRLYELGEGMQLSMAGLDGEILIVTKNSANLPKSTGQPRKPHAD